MSNPADEKQMCACRADDRYECWRRRYGLDPEDDVEQDGGPCECSCHDKSPDDDPDYFEVWAQR